MRGAFAFPKLMLALLPMMAWAPAPMASTLVGNAVTVVRDVKGLQERQERVLIVDDDVFQDEEVVTGPGAASRLVFKDNTNMSIGASSRLRLTKLVFDPDPSKSKVAMKAALGVFRFATGNLPSNAYTISTPVANISVRGTVIEFTITGQGTTTVYVAQGAATVTSYDGTSVDLEAGQATTVVAESSDGGHILASSPTPPETPSSDFARAVRNMTLMVRSDEPDTDFSTQAGGSSSSSGGFRPPSNPFGNPPPTFGRGPSNFNPPTGSSSGLGSPSRNSLASTTSSTSSSSTSGGDTSTSTSSGGTSTSSGGTSTSGGDSSTSTSSGGTSSGGTSTSSGGTSSSSGGTSTSSGGTSTSSGGTSTSSGGTSASSGGTSTSSGGTSTSSGGTSTSSGGTSTSSGGTSTSSGGASSGGTSTSSGGSELSVTTKVTVNPTRVGTSSVAIVSFTRNGGSEDITGTLAALAGVFSGVGAGPDGLRIGSSGQAEYAYIFKPPARGTFTDNLAFSLTELGAGGLIEMKGIGVGPAIAGIGADGTVQTFDFGTTKKTIDFSITNSGDAGYGDLSALTLIDFALSGPGAELFKLEGFEPGKVLQAGESLDLKLTFDPATLALFGIPLTADLLEQVLLKITTDMGTEFGGRDGQELLYRLNWGQIIGAITEPAVAGLLVTSLLGLALLRRRRSRK